MNPIVEVLVCHSNRLVAECLTRVLSGQEATRCRMIHVPWGSLRPTEVVADVILLDALLPKNEAFAMIESVRRANRDSRILLLVAVQTVDRILDFFDLGIDGCLFEDASICELQTAIVKLLEGGNYCSPQVANALLAQGRNGSTDGKWLSFTDDISLTPREREVLELIAWERLGNKQIARRLHISQYTVKNHVSKIIAKLGVQDRREAADVAAQRQLLATVR